MADNLTVPTCDLLALLRDTSAFASRQHYVPGLAGVLLHTATDDRGDTLLVGSATDRFCATQITTGATGALPAPVFLTLDQTRQIITAMRPYSSRKRTALAETAITVGEGRVTIRQLALDRLADMSVTVPHEPASNTFPDIARLIREASDREGTGDPFHLDGAQLARFARIAGLRGGAMKIRTTGTNRPVVVQIGRANDAELVPVVAYPAPVLEAA